MPKLTQKPFNSYRIEYGITNPSGKDLARIDFLLGETKAGQALFGGDAIAPGAFAALVNDGEIHLFFPLSHFHNVMDLLGTHCGLSLFVEVNETAERQVSRGGIMTHPLQGGGVAADIDVTPTTLDFGNVPVEQTENRNLAVKNRGSAPLNVTGLASSNPRFSAISPTVPFTVGSGGQQSVTVRFSPTAPGVQTGALFINSNDPHESTVSVALQGRGALPE